MDELRSDRIVDGISLDNLGDDSDNDDTKPNANIPGANSSKLNDGSRKTRPEIFTFDLKFSPTGREFAVATTQGLLIYALDEAINFAPTDLDISITPQSIAAAVASKEFGRAVNMALHLGEKKTIKTTIDSIDIAAMELVVQSIDVRMLRQVILFLTEELVRFIFNIFYLIFILYKKNNFLLLFILILSFYLFFNIIFG